MPLYFIYIAVLLGSAIFGAAHWKLLKSRFLHLFVPLLFLTLAVELYCYYIVQKWNLSTGWIYNIFLLLETVFFSVFYYLLPLTKRFRPVILGMLIAFGVAELIVYCGVQSIHTFNTYLFLAGAFLIVICGIFFLYEYFQLDSATQEKNWLPVVWITAGVIIFFSVSSITIALYRSIVSYQVTILGAKLHQVIPQLLSIIRYSCVATAFYLCKKKN